MDKPDRRFVMKSITYQGIEVEVSATFTTGDGRKLACVHAKEGRPFQEYTHGGWSESANARVPVDRLEVVDQPINLLDLALTYSDKPQWYAGEVINLWGNNHRGAYLRESNGTVNLCVIGYDPSVIVFYLTFDGWRVAEKLNEKYEVWSSKAVEVVNGDKQTG